MSQKTWDAVDRYIDDVLVGHDDALRAAVEASAAGGLPAIQVSAAQGKLLHLMARAIGARRILEVGTLGGYSAIWLARALPAGGRLVTLELDPHHADVARANLARAGLTGAVDLRVGPAIETLPRLAAEKAGPFDLSFIDADKPGNADYFRWALTMSRAGSVIIVDNTVREGGVVDGTSEDPGVRGVRRLNDLIASEPRVSATTIQTVGAKGYDGFTLAVVVG